MAEALAAGGGHAAPGLQLGSGLTHIVCDPGAALRWLHLGVGLVSPSWVLHSLRAGAQQRCVSISADATRHLPADTGAAAGANQRPATAPVVAALASREARLEFLSQLAAPGDTPHKAGAWAHGRRPARSRRARRPAV